MKNKMIRKLQSNRGGIKWPFIVLIVMIIVLLVLIAIPAWKDFQYKAQKIGCDQAMKSAGDGLIIEYLGTFEEVTTEEAMKQLDKIMPARDELCPAGGSIYLTKGENGIFVPVCGLHDNDKKERVRLNASYAKILLEAELLKAEESGSSESSSKQTSEPEKTAIVINSKKLDCVHVQKEEPIHHGTDYTQDYKEIVAFYGLEGEGEFDSDFVKKGKISYFVYADENYCAIWRASDGWSGDAYS
jgi:hypothetical protein